jgi:hypothetical protein
MKYGHVELTLHGLYHEVDGKIEDFDTELLLLLVAKKKGDFTP